MKPHANLHALSNPLLALRANPSAAVAGQEALLPDGADAGFASIMAQQLAQVVTDGATPDGDAMTQAATIGEQLPESDLPAAQTELVEPPWQAMQPQPDGMPWMQPPVPQPLVPNTPTQPANAINPRTVGDAAQAGVLALERSTAQMPEQQSSLVGVEVAADTSPSDTARPVDSRAAAAPGHHMAVSAEADKGAHPVATERLSAPIVRTGNAETPLPTVLKEQRGDRSRANMTNLMADQPFVTAPSDEALSTVTLPPATQHQSVELSGQQAGARLAQEARVVAPVSTEQDRISSVPLTRSEPSLSLADANHAPGAVSQPTDEWTAPRNDGQPRLPPATVTASQFGRVPPEQAPEPALAKASASIPSGAAFEPVLPGTTSVNVNTAAPQAPTTVAFTNAVTMATPAPASAALVTAKAAGSNAGLTLGSLLASTAMTPRAAPSTVDAFFSRTAARASDAKPGEALPWAAQQTMAMTKPLGESQVSASSAAPAPVSPGAEYVALDLPETAEFRPGEAWPSAVSLPQVSAMPWQPLPGRHEVASMQQTVGTSAFTDELVGHVNVWVKQAGQDGPMTAELHLNPADMGPVMIRIEVDGQMAQVNFAAQHADTRQAIEASLSVLSASLEEAGIQLSGSGVSDQGGSPQQAWGFDSRSDGQPRQSSQAFAMASGQEQAHLRVTPDGVDEDAWQTTPASRSSSSASGLDLYA